MKLKKIISLIIASTTILNTGCKKDNSFTSSYISVSSDVNTKIYIKNGLIFDSDYNPISTLELYNFNDSKIDYVDIISASKIISYSSLFLKEEKNTDIYKWSSYFKNDDDDVLNGSIYFDISKNEVYSDNFLLFSNILAVNNKVTCDFISNLTNTISTSNKSKIVKNSNKKIINLRNYSIKLIEYKGKLYIPLSLFKTILQFSSNINISFNGFDIYLNSTSSIYNEINKCSFKLKDNNYITLSKTDESYQYNNDDISFTLSKENEIDSDFILKIDDSLSKDILNNFKLFKYKGILKNKGEIIDNYNVIILKDDKHEILLNYQKENDSYSILSKSIVYLIDTYSSLNTIDNELINDNYNSLKLIYEYSYPLKKKEYSTFEKLLTSLSINEELLSNNPVTYQEAIYKLFIEGFNDIHSTYMYPSSIIKNSDNFNDDLLKKYQSERYNKLIENKNKLSNLKDENNIFPLYIVDNTAYISFDNFIISNDKLQINEAISKDYTIYYQSDTPRFIRSCFNNIESNPNIKNVVFDLSLNTGGSIISLIDTLGFILDDPYIRIDNYLDDSIKEYHYSIDTNLDGVFDYKDYYQNKYNFYILQSNVTFSSANEFVTIIKEKANAKLIGETTAGGSSIIFYYNDMFGSSFTISSSFSFSYKKEESYQLNDTGITPDYNYDSSYFYDRENLTEYINNI